MLLLTMEAGDKCILRVGSGLAERTRQGHCRDDTGHNGSLVMCVCVCVCVLCAHLCVLDTQQHHNPRRWKKDVTQRSLPSSIRPLRYDVHRWAPVDTVSGVGVEWRGACCGCNVELGPHDTCAGRGRPAGACRGHPTTQTSIELTRIRTRRQRETSLWSVRERGLYFVQRVPHTWVIVHVSVALMCLFIEHVFCHDGV